MSTVWIPKSASHDFDNAASFGQLVIIYDDSRDLFNPDRLLERAREALKNSSPDDCVLLSGPAMMSIAVYQAFKEKHGHVNVLLFQPRSNDYCKRIVA